jgi:hypothetical protein
MAEYVVSLCPTIQPWRERQQDASSGQTRDDSGSSGRTVIVHAKSAVDAVAVAERLNPGYIVEEKGVARRSTPLRKSPATVG